MTHLVRAARLRAADAVVVLALVGAWISTPARADAIAAAQATQTMVDVANVTIKAFENAIEGLRKQIGDAKLDQALDKTKTPAQQKQAVEDRIRSVTGLGKGVPLPDQPPEFASDTIRQAYAIRALLDAIETWKKLKAAWADTYKKITGKDARNIALLPAGGRNICTTDQFAYSTVAVSTTQLAGLVPKTDIASAAPSPVVLAQSGVSKHAISAYYDGRSDLYGIANLSYKPGRWMTGDQLKMAFAPSGVGGASDYSVGLTGNYRTFKLPLRLDGMSDPIGDGKAIGAIFGCPGAENVEVVRSTGGALYGQNARAGALTILTKADCHRTAAIDLGDPPSEHVFRKFELRGGYMCSSDRLQQQHGIAELVAALADKGVRANPASARTDYFGAAPGTGYCVTSFADYSTIQNQCVGDLSQLSIPRYEFGQERVGQPAVVSDDRRDPIRLAQAAPAVRGGSRRIESLPNDHHFLANGNVRAGLDDQWGLKRIGFAAAPPDGTDSLWPKSATPVLVAVVDSGIDPTHPDLAGALWANPKEIPGNGADDDGNGFVDDVFGWNFINGSNNTWDNNGHGTFVAGIIAARTHDAIGIAGVNPWARILPVKVTDFHNKGDHLHLAAGIYYAAQAGARVINVSIGGKRLTLGEQYAIDFAVRKGALVVVAAGNEGVDTSTFSPAGAAGAITVAATDADDKRAGFSNFGAKVDIAAPGVDILSLRARQTDLMALYDKDYKAGANIVGDDRLYYRLSGTSFAAPYVSGVASLLFAIDPSLKPEQVKRIILQSARDIDVPGHDQFTGYGLLDARAALKADPNFFVDARISGAAAARHDGQVVIVPSGTAAADRLKRAWIEVGKGKDPTEWVKASDDVDKPVEAGQLALVPVRHFSGPGLWTIRLVVEHANGTRREARHELNLR
jgi:hypothetical protein